jgi:hypothetical protein
MHQRSRPGAFAAAEKELVGVHVACETLEPFPLKWLTFHSYWRIAAIVL